MASRAIRGRRMRMLNDLGFGEISRIYVTEAGSVRKLCQMLFEPRYEGEEVGCSSFYDWLRKNNYQEIWKETVKVREMLLKEAIVQVPEDHDWDFWQLQATLEVSARTTRSHAPALGSQNAVLSP